MKRKNIFVIFSVVLGAIFLLAAQCEKPGAQACKNKYEKVIKLAKTEAAKFKEKKDSTLPKDSKIYLQNVSKNLETRYKFFEKKKDEAFDACEKNPDDGNIEIKKFHKKLKEFSLILKDDNKISEMASNAKNITQQVAKTTEKKLEDLWKLDEE